MWRRFAQLAPDSVALPRVIDAGAPHFLQKMGRMCKMFHVEHIVTSM
jgi:hypothetical protein